MTLLFHIRVDFVVTVVASGAFHRAVVLMEKALSDPKADTQFFNDARKLIARCQAKQETLK